jgi:Flp pilus assembly pilin Flp
MRSIIGLAHCIARNRDGATAIEYAFLAALLAMAIVGSAMAIGNELTASFFDVAESFPDVD